MGDCKNNKNYFFKFDHGLKAGVVTVLNGTNVIVNIKESFDSTSLSS